MFCASLPGRSPGFCFVFGNPKRERGLRSSLTLRVTIALAKTYDIPCKILSRVAPHNGEPWAVRHWAPDPSSRVRRILRCLLPGRRARPLPPRRSSGQANEEVTAPFARLTFTIVLLVFLGQVAYADHASDQSGELFEKQIRPVLIKECQRCHGDKKQQGNLRLDSRSGWMTGGDTGAAVVAGDMKSLLLTAIRYEDSDLEMPPKGKLPDETIEAFEKWVELGAVDPRGQSQSPPVAEPIVSPSVDEGKSFWSFQPITSPEIPEVRQHDWPQVDIDRFVLSSLEQQGLKHSGDADPQTLLRRLFYDLIGLPPTPQQVAAFAADPSPQAYEETVTRLLASHEFGQRWGRHWLDVVRFAESSGGGRTLLFPDAWRYRDYVIESFNDDVPYDQFVTQQIAGDLLETDDWRQRRRNLVATAFLLLGPTNYELQDKDVLEMDVVDEQLDTIGKAMLGMTIGCARCHDHKFDPIPATDYYAMAGILKSSRALKHSNVSEWNKVDLPLSPQEADKAERISDQLKNTKHEAKAIRKRWIDAGGRPPRKEGEKSIAKQDIAGIVIDSQHAEKTGNWTESTSIAYFVGKNYLFDASDTKSIGKAIFRPNFPDAGRYEIQVSYSPGSNRATNVPVHVDHVDGRTTVNINQREKPSIDEAFESLGVFQLSVGTETQVTVSCANTSDGVVIADAVVFIPMPDANAVESETVTVDAERVQKLKQRLDRLEKRIQKIEQSKPKTQLAMAMGDQQEPADIHLAIRGVTNSKGALTSRGVLRVASWQEFPSISDGQSGRRELADWIVDPNNPLAARVMVNRVWYWLVGQGIVTTVDNFGSMGQLPTNPELLDHLASSFVRDGWSIKRLIHRIVTSRTYRQSSEDNHDSYSIDPDNRFVWRMNRKRLRAEDIRDSLLFIAGQLDVRHGGSNIKSGTKREYGYKFDSVRCSVYVPVFRNALPEIFEVFDFADPNIQNGERSSSTVSSQALLMMNHPFVMDQARGAAARNLENSDLQTNERIDLAYREVVGRPPTSVEAKIALDLISGSDHNDVEHLAMLYQVLFQCIDFRYMN
jgi:hypothetical protein